MPTTDEFRDQLSWDEDRRAAVSLGIVCPMANESDNACNFVRDVLRQCEGFKAVTMFVVLDRATTDNTRTILDQFAQTEPRLCVVWAPENSCVVDAYIRGYREALAAGCDWILEIDAGYSHQPEDISQFFSKLEEGYDCAFGTRFALGGRITESSFKRKIVSKGGTLITNFFLGTRLSDMTSGFECFSRSALQMVLDRGIKSRGHFFQTEIKFYCSQLRVAEVPIHYKAASPRLSGAAIGEAFRQLWRLYSGSRISTGDSR